jgi:lipopolysaccharide transport system permease protein
MSSEPWSLVIKPHSKWWDLPLADVWRYRDLLWLFVRRDLVTAYTQTILGPLWFIVQPILTTILFTVVFAGIGKISTDGQPPMLFYLAGVTPWNYFATCLTKTSNTFVSNSALFGKVYFPRLVVPLSVVISNLIQFGVQFLAFLGFLAWFSARGATITLNVPMIALLTPLLLVLMAVMGLATGILVSSLTTRYRDLTFLVGFGVQLAMYTAPVIYPMSVVPVRQRWLVHANPMSAIIEAFRAIYLGGSIPWSALASSGLVALGLFALGIVFFNRIEKTFIDTV